MLLAILAASEGEKSSVLQRPPNFSEADLVGLTRGSVGPFVGPLTLACQVQDRYADAVRSLPFSHVFFHLRRPGIPRAPVHICIASELRG